MRYFGKKKRSMLWLSYGYVMVILWYWLEIGTRLGRKTSLQPSLKGRGKEDMGLRPMSRVGSGERVTSYSLNTGLQVGIPSSKV